MQQDNKVKCTSPPPPRTMIVLVMSSSILLAPPKAKRYPATHLFAGGVYSNYMGGATGCSARRPNCPSGELATWEIRLLFWGVPCRRSLSCSLYRCFTFTHLIHPVMVYRCITAVFLSLYTEHLQPTANRQIPNSGLPRISSAHKTGHGCYVAPLVISRRVGCTGIYPSIYPAILVLLTGPRY